MQAIQLLSEGHGGEGLVWLLYVILGLFLLTIIVGWLTAGSNQEPPFEAVHEAPKPKSKANRPQTKRKNKKA